MVWCCSSCTRQGGVFLQHYRVTLPGLEPSSHQPKFGMAGVHPFWGRPSHFNHSSNNTKSCVQARMTHMGLMHKTPQHASPIPMPPGGIGIDV